MPIVFAKKPFTPIGIEELDPTKNEIWGAKIDGAHTIGVLQKGLPPDFYSHRISKRTGDNIKYNDKLTHTPKVSKIDAQIRLETYAIDKSGHAIKPELITELLNSLPLNSLAMQKKLGLQTRTAIIDIDHYNGIDYKDVNPLEKLEAMNEIASIHPEFELPAFAKTPSEKKQLLNKIISGKYKPTKEGVIIHPLDEGHSLKAKVIQTHDVYVRNVFPELSETDRMPMAGGFTYSYSPDGPVMGRIGTGFNHELKKDMYENPNKYIGMAARVTALDKSRHGILMKPAFKGWDIDKNIDHPDLNAIPLIEGKRIKSATSIEWNKKLITNALKQRGILESKLPIMANIFSPQAPNWQFPNTITHKANLEAIKILQAMYPKHMPLKVAEEYAPGIPNKETFHTIRTGIDPKKWEFVLQKHDADKAKTHYDLRLGDPETGHGHSWAIRNGLPTQRGEVRLAVRQPTHTIPYFDFEGEIPSGYGKGSVTTAIRDKADVHESGEHKVKFSLNDGKDTYVMFPTDANKWLILKKFPKPLNKIALEYKHKLAGGPGSGTDKDNTDYIVDKYPELSISPLISIGKRKQFMEEHPIKETKEIPLSKIKYVSQHKFVPEKLARIKKELNNIEKPIDVLLDKEGFYHVMDGHHRFLAAWELNKKTILANIYEE